MLLWLAALYNIVYKISKRWTTLPADGLAFGSRRHISRTIYENSKGNKRICMYTHGQHRRWREGWGGRNTED